MRSYPMPENAQEFAYYSQRAKAREPLGVLPKIDCLGGLQRPIYRMKKDIQS